MSPKRARQLAEAGIPALSTFAGSRASFAPVAAKPARRSTGPDKLTVETVWLRDGGRCAWCGLHISGERGRDWSVSHRRPRRMGGDRRPDTNSPANCVLLHGDGATRCHGEVESQRARALAAGHILHDTAVPSQVPILHAVFDGMVYLSDDGGVSATPPRRSA